MPSAPTVFQSDAIVRLCNIYFLQGHECHSNLLHVLLLYNPKEDCFSNRGYLWAKMPLLSEGFFYCRNSMQPILILENHLSWYRCWKYSGELQNQSSFKPPKRLYNIFRKYFWLNKDLKMQILEENNSVQYARLKIILWSVAA